MKYLNPRAADVLRFQFSFYDTSSNAAEVVSKDKELMAVFEMVREFANEPNTSLRVNLNLAIAAKNEDAMYSPLIKASNYALEWFSRCRMPGFSEFQENRQIVFARGGAKWIESGSCLQGSYKPDIVLAKWNVFKRAQAWRSWRRWQQWEEHIQGRDRPPHQLQKRHRDPLESYGTTLKKSKSDTNTTPGGTSKQRAETPSEPGVKESNESEVEELKRSQKQAPKVQSAIYASHKISSSFGISYTINLALIGTSFHLTWIDRQNVIESRAIDLVDDLLHFLLLLLILQRFGDAEWGYFTRCPRSGMKTGQGITTIYPDDHEIYLGMTLLGRGATVIGRKRGPPPDPTQLGDTSNLQEGSDLVVKIYWPEEKRISEVETLRKAKEYGGKIGFIGNHTPGMCFLCHFCLWKKGIRHGDISLRNLMSDNRRKAGVLNDFDLARCEWTRQHWDVTTHGARSAIGRGSTWRNPSSLLVQSRIVCVDSDLPVSRYG
ncbi:hypothetical protein BDM02DRAFT_3194011 [Thelephora ganbajun]|uniref:Uncharacterized protein n=1 Tax=Thelephora ganbajun TaxID=370292 RepID=A0ACB6YX75_THEGA|nr:hypothetical protein BDM02DRAFT_3194011 [Thelephora ganbajun]